MDLRANELLPKLFAQRLANRHLLGHTPDDLRVVGQRQEHASGQVIGSADDHHGVEAHQCRQQGVGVGALLLIDDQQPDVFAGDSGEGTFVALDDELVELDRQVCRLGRDFDGAFYHSRGFRLTKVEKPSVAGAARPSM